MTCPRCFSELEPARGTCPECGISLYRNVSGIIKTSVVMISTGGDDNFYPSVQDVPEPLRRQLIESTSSGNAGTIVIADRAGKEQLTQIMARRLDGTRIANSRETVSSALPGDPQPEKDKSLSAPHAIRRISWLAWAGFLFVLALAALFSLFFGMRW